MAILAAYLAASRSLFTEWFSSILKLQPPNAEPRRRGKRMAESGETIWIVCSDWSSGVGVVEWQHWADWCCRTSPMTFSACPVSLSCPACQPDPRMEYDFCCGSLHLTLKAKAPYIQHYLPSVSKQNVALFPYFLTVFKLGFQGDFIEKISYAWLSIRKLFK